MILVSSALAIVGGLIVALLVREGPFASAGARFNPRFALSIFTRRGLRLANFGYLGHQWELYAMWTWVPIFLAERVTTGGGSTTLATLLAFAVVGSGGIGCLVAGAGADRVGRTATTSAAMIVSGSMAVLAAVLSHRASPAAHRHPASLGDSPLSPTRPSSPPQSPNSVPRSTPARR